MSFFKDAFNTVGNVFVPPKNPVTQVIPLTSQLQPLTSFLQPSQQQNNIFNTTVNTTVNTNINNTVNNTFTTNITNNTTNINETTFNTTNIINTVDLNPLNQRVDDIFGNIRAQSNSIDALSNVVSNNFQTLESTINQQYLTLTNTSNTLSTAINNISSNVDNQLTKFDNKLTTEFMNVNATINNISNNVNNNIKVLENKVNESNNNVLQVIVNQNEFMKQTQQGFDEVKNQFTNFNQRYTTDITNLSGAIIQQGANLEKGFDQVNKNILSLNDKIELYRPQVSYMQGQGGSNIGYDDSFTGKRSRVVFAI